MGAAANTASSPFRFVGGDLCLDFTNTMGGKRGVAPRVVQFGVRVNF